MEILSYPIGLLIGLFPIAASLGPSKAPAHLLLDGRPVCELTERSPGCMVDLGPDPRVHLLELLRTDTAGHVTERVRRWVNRPGIEAEILAAGGCDEAARRCDFELTWAHPLRLDPKRIDISLDGTPVWNGKERRASVSLGAKARPQVLVADAEFPDGTRATYSRTLYASYPEEAQAALQAVPLLPSPGSGTDETLAAALRTAGWPVRTVEETELEITFVMQPTAFDRVPDFLSIIPNLPGTHQQKIGAITGSDMRVGVVVPNQSLSTYRIAAARLGRSVPITVPSVSWTRHADAVAAAGYELGSSPRRRAVVLVLNRFEHVNASTFDARQAQAFLSEVLVPLVVWRIGPAEVGPEWPEGPVIANSTELASAFDALVADVGRQRIAWLEGARDLRFSGRQVAPGIVLAGRSAPGEPVETPPESAESAERAVSLGPFGGEVHTLAATKDDELVYAGTHAGIFRSLDGGHTWEAAGRGVPPAPVRSLALSADPTVTAYAATDAGLFRSEDGGNSWKGIAGPGAPVLPTRVALDGRHIYVGTRGGGVLRSGDEGKTFLRTTLGSGEVRSLAVNPRDRTVWAATENGLFRSVDRGSSWTPAPGVPATILGLAVDPRGRIYAATAGDGMFTSSDRGESWRATKLGNAYLTDVAAGAGALGPILASSPDGIFSTLDDGASWKLARVGPVGALAPIGAEGWAAGGASGILRADAARKGWTASNSGLAATSVFSLASLPGPRPALVAGTARGMFRSDGGESWKRVPGTPEAVEFYAMALASGQPSAAPDLLVGSSGEIGRSFGLDGSWSWLPAPAVFGLTVDPARPRLAFAATRGAPLRSEDGGLTWQASAEGLSRTFPLQLAVDPANATTVFAATAGSGVYRSADGGRTWKPFGSELSRTIVRSLASDGSAADRLYAGTDRGVFGSLPAMRRWAPLTNGLPRSPVYALLADPETPATLFAGTGEGLFITRDAGQSWAPVAGGAVPAPVTALTFDRSNRRLYAGTLGAGVFAVARPD